ncbi:TIGR01244 family sulfur transferase [Marinomonas sp. FW-1]|uniref:TIGR01244 family sulfur transferase n=1 Tax=Marinomonas sp. FW-1 TaxID=2071621 RepID=UPI0010C03A07|nr:TIGR01244 family sulfur transferase [Marinomonas sp. FW-1]
MNNVIQLDSLYYVAPQILLEDIEVLKDLGFERVINNRPDFESEDQPTDNALRAKAEALGLEYVSNPIDLSKLSKEHVEVQSDALGVSKKTLAFCRTGTRSSVLWLLSENAKGKSSDELSAYVAGKGFDLSRCAAAMAPLLNK